FVADDHTVVRHGLKLILETQSDFTIVGEADNGRDALAQVGQSCPDIVIMDIAMPDLNGIEAARLIRDVCPATQIILLTMHSPTNLIIRAIQAGVKGYLLKGVASSELITAVHTVYSNQRYLDKKIVKQLGSKALDKPEAQGITDPLDKLSSREREVLQLVVEGRSSAEIAEKLSLSIKTIETYRHRLMRKLDINDIPSLVKFAIRHRLTPLE
ncbi:MAG: response regulator transcription factor, partial [Anaerolineae bacterium]|nr:response regulator transcription factor [Anaerolineae bacterium]